MCHCFPVPVSIDLTYETKLLIPGYDESVYLNETRLILEEYLKRNKLNVLRIDWLKLSKLRCYPTFVSNVRHAGKCVADFLKKLHTNHPEFKIKNLHVIGFSLGAHVPSFASDLLQAQIGVKFARITGLDPALPLFLAATRRWKLDPSDADFVDVIHTNSGEFGKVEPCGHVDFYVNGGRRQSVCENDTFPARCSHLMVLPYFTDTISTNTGFWTTQCESYLEYLFTSCRFNVSSTVDQNNQTPISMGEHCPKSARGVYYVETNSSSPFALYQYKIMNSSIAE
ncbi:endothelial lipase-like [Malaya genurostris]|uniref:endothelial lipase-like n=1 Tax=Malaya genurostris TaxID=325434 RepID=UPI0026F38B9F|nr:endothelial lipase-like [Malaya genurostris]